MQAVLVMFRNDGERRSFSISRETTVIGRRQDCDLMIPLGEISRKHCRIIKDDDALRLEDLGSSNGTFHNGRRVQEATLSAGDTVTVGPVSFVVQIDGVPAEDEMHPSGGAAAGGAMLSDDDDLDALDSPGSHELEGADDLAGDPDELEPISSADDEGLESLDDDESPTTLDLDDTGMALEAEHNEAAANASKGTSLDDELEGLLGAPDSGDDDEPLELDDEPRKK